MMLLYHLLWSFPLVLGLAARFSGNKRLRARFALDLPEPLPKDGNLWIHALSVGEVLSAVPLVERLKTAFPDRDVVFSVTTRSGMAMADEKISDRAACLMTLPVDIWWCMRRAIRHVRPSVFILVETDIWPGLLGFLKQKGIRCLWVNGRISPRTLRAYRKAPVLVRRMIAPLEYCLMQTELDRDRLLSLGMDPEKVVTVGNIKFDRKTPALDSQERKRWRGMLGLTSGTQVWVAGSTHEGEETVLLNVFRDLKKDFPLLRLVVAPRDVGRSPEIVDMVRGRGMAVALRSRAKEKARPHDVLVLDTVGELGRIYGIGHVAFVGGSFAPIGGHNLLEPAGFGVPVLFGPHTHNFELMSESILKAGGAYRVQSGAELYDAVKRLLSHEGLREKTGERAKAFVVENRGALERVVSYVARNIGAG